MVTSLYLCQLVFSQWDTIKYYTRVKAARDEEEHGEGQRGDVPRGEGGEKEEKKMCLCGSLDQEY